MSPQTIVEQTRQKQNLTQKHTHTQRQVHIHCKYEKTELREKVYPGQYTSTRTGTHTHRAGSGANFSPILMGSHQRTSLKSLEVKKTLMKMMIMI